MAFSRKEPNAVQAQRVGDSDIWILPSPEIGSARLRIPVPPSCNVRQKPVYRVRRTVWGNKTGVELGLTEEAKGYLMNAVVLRMAWKRVMPRPIEDFTKITFRFFLANPAYDTHNGLKLACDMMQKSGMVLNDRLILPQVEVPESAPSDPRLIISFPVPVPAAGKSNP